MASLLESRALDGSVFTASSEPGTASALGKGWIGMFQTNECTGRPMHRGSLGVWASQRFGEYHLQWLGISSQNGKETGLDGKDPKEGRSWRDSTTHDTKEREPRK